jgi:23S rRNA pseudouridine2605 synthase
MIRLQKYIADAGITSRRKAEVLIEEGRVAVNGKKVTLLGTKVDPSKDVVTVKGEVIDPDAVDRVYMVLHKPRGYMTTVSDPEGRKTVMDLIPASLGRVYPVGRLDYLSEGLLIMTNDGELANDIIHPSSNITKVYEVKVFGGVNHKLLKELRAGFDDPEVGAIRPQSVRVIKQLPSKTWLEVRISDGKNREIRRLCEGHGLTIDKLKRVSIGGLAISGIGPGSYEFITKRQLEDAIKEEFQSDKKSIKVKNRPLQAGPHAADKTFLRFRKENYFDTINQRKEKLRQIELQKKQEREEQDREYLRKREARKKRLDKKREDKMRGVHAMVVK